VLQVLSRCMPAMLGFTLLFVVSQKGTKKQIGCRWLDRAKVFEDALVTEQYKMHTLLYYEFVLRV
jgi:hypothetical protein